MFKAYEPYKPHKASRLKIEAVNAIVEEYKADGLTLSLRQIYYQLVSTNMIANNESEYKKLIDLLTNARWGGMVSWEAIEDRTRDARTLNFHEEPEALIELLPDMLTFDHWERQDTYVEVWVEKDALGNIISLACEPYDVPYLTCKGYVSTSEMFAAGQRFEQRLNAGKDCVILYLGDLDPSGWNMPMDINNRMSVLCGAGAVEIRRIGLNPEQVEEFGLIPNYAKMTDSRSKDFVAVHGNKSYELDALRADYLERLLSKEISALVDEDAWNNSVADETNTRQRLSRISDNYEAIDNFLNGI